jgi:Multicopper oxidase
MHYISRRAIVYDSAADDDGILAVGATAAGDGTYMQEQVLVQHNGSVGKGFRVYKARHTGVPLGELPDYAYHYPMDVVVALPGEVTTIRAKFDKPGEYNWHCHILSHEDHEMMRRYHVGQLPTPATAQPPPPPPASPPVRRGTKVGPTCDGDCSSTSTNVVTTTTTSRVWWRSWSSSWNTYWHS